MAQSPMLELRSVSKYFCRDARLAQRYGVTDMVRALIPAAGRNRGPRKGEFASLDAVSLSVRHGEAVAIMGPNGAGKTTLLRLVAGLIRPDQGSVRRTGRINCVIELGQGLNPQLTGRENAELGLAWRGLSRAGAAALLAPIADFAELGDAFDSPVGTYSTGMRMRLAFAIAIHVPCDLLLLDEVLAVGDIRFQRKCIAHIQRHLHRGGSLILVSHNIPQVLAVCERGIVLDRGRILFDGTASAAADILFDQLACVEGEASTPSESLPAAGPVRITKVAARHSEGGSLRSGEAATFELDFVAEQPIDAICSLTIWTLDLATCVTGAFEQEPAPAVAGANRRHCTFDRLVLIPGTYAVRFSILDPETLHPLAMLGFDQPPLTVKVAGRTGRTSALQRNVRQLVVVDYSWRCSEAYGDDSADRQSEGTEELSSFVG